MHVCTQYKSLSFDVNIVQAYEMKKNNADGI